MTDRKPQRSIHTSSIPVPSGSSNEDPDDTFPPPSSPPSGELVLYDASEKPWRVINYDSSGRTNLVLMSSETELAVVTAPPSNPSGSRGKLVNSSDMLRIPNGEPSLPPHQTGDYFSQLSAYHTIEASSAASEGREDSHSGAGAIKEGWINQGYLSFV